MKEFKHEVITQGTPKLKKMPKEVFNVFCTSLLAAIEDYYKNDNQTEEKTGSKKSVAVSYHKRIKSRLW